MGAVPGPGAFDGDLYSGSGARLAIGGYVSLPSVSIEICCQESAGVLFGDGVDAQGVETTEVSLNSQGIQGRKILVRACRAFYLWF